MDHFYKTEEIPWTPTPLKSNSSTNINVHTFKTVYKSADLSLGQVYFLSPLCLSVGV